MTVQEVLQLPDSPTADQLEVIEKYLKLKKKERKRNNYGKQNYYEDREDLIDGLCIFRHSAYKSKPYYMRYYIKDGRYKIVSLKTTDRNHAKNKAFDFEFEVLCKFAKQGYQVTEFPIEYYPRSFEQGKKLRAFKDGSKILKTMIR